MPVEKGEEFDTQITTVTQERLDGDAVKMLLDEMLQKGHITNEQKAACFKSIKFRTISTKRIDPSKAPPFSMPNLSNATPAGLIDMLGNVRENAKTLKKLEGIYKTKLESLMALPPINVDATTDLGSDES